MTDEEELAAFIVLATTMLGELEDAMHDTEVLALSELFATKSEKRLRRKVRKRRQREQHVTPPGERRPSGTGKRQARNRTYVLHRGEDPNYAHLTGVSAAQFEELLQHMSPHLRQTRADAERTSHKGIAHSWTEHTRLFMTLHWLRHYPTLACLANMFGGSQASVSRELWDTIIKLFCHFRTISWPDDDDELPAFAKAIGAIDCTSHLRWRVHPWSCEWYRGDVHAHFITSQLVCALSGRIWDVRLGLGHNNDQGMFVRTGTDEELRRRDIWLLGDGGYVDARVVCPGDAPDNVNSCTWRQRHAGFRSVVEQDFSLVHLWQASGGVFRQQPELQEMVIQVIYALVSFKYRDWPLRNLSSS